MLKNYKMMVLLLVLAVVLVSCGDGAAPEVGAPENGGGVAYEPGGPVLDELFPWPEHDFGGAVLTFLARQDGHAGGAQDFEDLYVEALTGEVLNDAVYYRNSAVEARFNVEIRVVYEENPVPAIANSVRAGDDAFQLVQCRLMFITQSLAVQGLLLDLAHVDGINLDAPWWNQAAISDLAINNRVTTLGGDMTVSDKSGMVMVVFNQRLLQDYALMGGQDFDCLYEMARQGRWTLDRMYELMTAATVDLDGDGQLLPENDQFGLMAEGYGGWMLAVGSGNRIAGLDSDGLPYLSAVTPKSIADYARILSVMRSPGRIDLGAPQPNVDIFANGRAFMSMDMLAQISQLRAMPDDFGIVPVPMQDEAQGRYITPLSAWVSRFIAVPLTAGDPEMVGAVLDAMARESGNTVVPAFYSNLLEMRVARSDESVGMLEIIFGSVVYDLGAVFNWAGVWDAQQQFIDGGGDNYAGFMEAREGAIQRAIDNTIEAMLD